MAGCIRRRKREVRREEGRDVAIVTSRDQLIENRELPFRFQRLAKFVDHKDRDVDQVRDDFRLRATRIITGTNVRQKVRELNESAGNLPRDRKVAEEERHDQRLAVADTTAQTDSAIPWLESVQD